MSEVSVPHITCEHLVSLQNEPQAQEHIVVDLRDPLEYDAGHIEGSVNIPRRELTQNITNLIPSKTHRVIVVVGPTHDAEISTIHQELNELGYENIEFLSGGFDRWCEISIPSVDELATEMTPEESEALQETDEVIDEYEGEDPDENNEPLM